ncbi:MAG TPA: hypothetical protein VM120_18175 [Bryobacteraceae bacterium]|nr:hypothetical protein [Bryobacteraceae bacterium]
MQKTRALYLAGLALAVSATAVETRFWQQYEAADYDKATLKKLSLRSDGQLTLAPVFKEIFDTSTAYVWAVAEDSKGNVYAGGGAPGSSTAKLFAIDAAGKGKVLAELSGLEIHAISIDKRDRVYAATSPDGKVYRVDANGKAEVFYDPKAKYIWTMAFDSKGNLFIATGDDGKVHRVAPDGSGSVFFKTDETHARSLAIDAKDNLIVGTEPGGLILRISPTGDGFVLHQANKREITAVAVAKNGAIYAAGVGNKQPAVAPPPPQVIVVTPVPPQGAATAVAARPQPASVSPTLTPAPSIAGGAEVYRIDPDGAPRRVWQHPSDIVYAIGFDNGGKLLLGTGNRGRIYRLDSDRLYTNLVSSTSTQITAFHSGRNGSVYAVASNIGKLFQLGTQLEKEGTLESEVFDSGAFSHWGRARYEGRDEGGAITIETRSGNLDRPQKNWSTWAPVQMDSTYGRTTSPSARFLQYRLKLAAAAKAAPIVSLVELAYLTKNVPPVVEEIETTPANYRFPAPSASAASSRTISLPAIGHRRPASGSSFADSSPGTMSFAKGHAGVRWKASDENGDALQFKVEIRGVGEKEWKLLKDNVRERYLSWDSTAFPDGEYQLRVSASDAPSNPPAQALQAMLESEAFLIDNTPPQITALSATAEKGRVAIRFKARDARSVIEKAEYSINGAGWLLIQPVTRLADSLELDYAITFERPAGGETVIAVRVTDEFENQSVDKATVR